MSILLVVTLVSMLLALVMTVIAWRVAREERRRSEARVVALGHQRDGDRLIVRGVIRNPSSGGRTDRLTAVVFLFDRDGGFVTSGRASIEPAVLPPGGESTFLVTVPGAADVGRYRVSFRSDSGIVPHVDRRTRS